jgi:hypothetical protein
MVPRVKEWFRALLYAPNGILYEDGAVMVGVQAQYNGFAGRMMLHFRNRASVRACIVCMCVWCVGVCVCVGVWL